jgi:hypothetical protein
VTPTLRPMSLGEILDRTFQIYRSRFLLFVTVATIPVLAWELTDFANSGDPDLRLLIHFHSHFLIFLMNFAIGRFGFYVFCLLAVVLEPAILKLTSDSVLLTNQSLASAFRFAFARWKTFLCLAFLSVSACWLIPDVAAAACYEGLDPSWAHPVLLNLMTFAEWGIASWLVVALSFAVPVAALEDIRGIESIRRGWALVKGTRARIWFVFVAQWISLWILTWVLQFLLGQSMHVAGSLLNIADAMRNLYPVAVVLLSTAIYAVVGPLYPIALTLFYYDQRIRHEGYDIERMMDAAGLNTTQTLPAADEPVTPAVAQEGLA